MGIIFALGALLSWGFGDFFIQRTAREAGIVRAIFFISAIGAIGITPFILGEIPEILASSHLLLLVVVAGLTLFITALFEFEGLKQGKISVIEPLMAMELPLTVALSIFFIGERLSALQIFLIVCIALGILLAITTRLRHLHYHRRFLEKGVLFAGIGAVGMAISNVLVGVSGQETSPLFAIWAINILHGSLAFLWLVARGKLRHLLPFQGERRLHILLMSVLDNAAWIFYVYAVVLIPISITIAISESYIILSVLLGILVNHEKVKRHQKIGMVLATTAVIILAVLSE